MREHKFHRIIGNVIDDLELSEERFQILKDTACGGIHKLSLFCSVERSRGTKFAEVDLLILEDNKVKVIIEIEESNVKPIHLFGKFLASAMSKFYIYGDKNVSPIGMAESVFFIQILDTFGFKDLTSKYKQWHLVEESIQSIIPIKESSIREYRLIFGNKDDFVEMGEKRSVLITLLHDLLRVKG